MTDPRSDKPEPVDLERNRRLVERLARERFERLRRVARRAGVAGDFVDDVVQSALVGVLRAYRGPSDLDQLYSYTARAVQNEAGKLHRRHARKESRQVAMPTARLPDRTDTRVFAGLVDPEASDPVDLAIDGEEVAAAVERLIALPGLERAVVVLGAAGFSQEEIGAIVGLSKRGVRKRVTRANARLRDGPPGAPPAP